MFISGFGLAFTYAPIYALCLLAYMPLFVIAISIYGKMAKGQVIAKIMLNAKLSAFTQEIIDAFKLVIAFGQELHTLTEYDKSAAEAKKQGLKTGVVNGFFMAVFITLMAFFQIFAMVIAYFFIANDVINVVTGELYTILDILVCFQALAYGMFTFGAIIGLI